MAIMGISWVDISPAIVCSVLHVNPELARVCNMHASIHHAACLTLGLRVYFEGPGTEKKLIPSANFRTMDSSIFKHMKSGVELQSDCSNACANEDRWSVQDRAQGSG